MSTKTYDPVTPRRVTFLGLGVMGAPMAGKKVTRRTAL